MKISLIAAVAANGVIGSENDLPWHLPADLRRFKRLTMGHHLLMGRRTFESIGRALPGRSMVVLSRGQPELPEGVVGADSLRKGLELARRSGDDECFVAGGAQIYALALPIADRLYLTRIHSEFEGDRHFPSFDETEWVELERQDHEASDETPFGFSFVTLDRA